MIDEEYNSLITTIQENAFNEVAKTNLADAEKFFSENSRNSDIVELETGKVQYQVLETGSGIEVLEHTAPAIRYTGKYIDGTIFGCSEDSGGPVTIPLDQTISGFSKALIGMKEGEKRRVFIHPEEGYGISSGHLPPNSLLIFDVEIVKTSLPLDNPLYTTDIAEETTTTTNSKQS